MIAASMITGGGLAWWHAWLCVWIGYFIAAMFICLTGRIGAVYHISFPVVARSSFGIWGSLWPVFNRAGEFLISCFRDLLVLISSQPWHAFGMVFRLTLAVNA